MMSDKYEVVTLFDGYSRDTELGSIANCTCTLIKGPKNIIVDTMTAWDGTKLIKALDEQQIGCDDINFVICTHGHSDHIGCNYLFKKAIHIVDYKIDDCIKVIATPGHTLQDVSVIVTTAKGIIAIVGDLFENEGDLKDDNIWKKAGSDCEELQLQNRAKILKIADWIIPGHGPMFKVN
ncbi:hypothetical protein FQR65_LT08144 [Abscondita terminalis]|nr:hypothetical protein FQR65_LT08144 [Abscondita terminalis]